jgi:N-carbamoylputrescine amidase
MADAHNLVTLGVVQFACSDDAQNNIETATKLVRNARGKGANIVLVQELFEGHYFCQEQNPKHFGRATGISDNPAVKAFQAIAKELGIVVPVSVFEKAGQVFYNTVAMIDADGSLMGTYRKSHIPDGPGYNEKYYFRAGDTGFKVWDTRFGKVGVGICWDQWFPEAARAMALMGAEFLLYPTAIGSEPGQPDFDTMEHWRITMRGHAGANMLPVAAANRIGTEVVAGKSQTYYGSSFIAGADGALLADGPRTGETVLTATFDREKLAANRAAWGLYRDRRPELYGVLTTADGRT